MILATYEKLEKCNSFYVTVDVSEITIDGEYLTLHQHESFGDIYITDNMKYSLCRYVGMSASVSRCLYENDKDLWYKVVSKLYKYYSNSSLILLISEDSDGRYYVKGLCNNTRDQLINDKFINDVVKYYESYEDVNVVDVGYSKDLSTSHVVITFSKLYKDVKSNEFRLGVVFRNDELNSTYCRLAVVYNGGVIYYLPSKYYNLTTSRYTKSTSSTEEALQIILLKVYEDYMSGHFDNISNDINSMISETSNKYLSRTEYEQIKSVIVNASVSSDIDDKECSEILTDLEIIDDFEDLYGDIESDYIWKCTAIGGATLSKVYDVVGGILREHKYYPEEENRMRDLLGEYLSTPRMCQMLAKKL